MKAFLVRLGILGFVACCLVALVIIVPDRSTQVGDVDIHVQKGNAWEELGREPFERLLILYKDGTIYSMTENSPDRVSIPLDYIERVEGHPTSDMLVIIHNHMGLHRASPKDIELYNTLVNRGFHGFFLIKLGDGSVIEYPGDH